MGNSKERIPLQRVDTNRWCIPKQYNAEMHVPGMTGHSLGLRLSCGRSGGDLR